MEAEVNAMNARNQLPKFSPVCQDHKDFKLTPDERQSLAKSAGASGSASRSVPTVDHWRYVFLDGAVIVISEDGCLAVAATKDRKHVGGSG
jgi:hypothetical protein